MPTPRVSVIIPVYNCGRYISDAVESVLSQTFRDYELIIVDDGSTDETVKIVEGFGDRAILIRQINKGPAVARNVGIRRAQGELIAFLDGDDMWLENKLALQVGYMDAHPEAAMSFTDLVTFDSQGLKSEAYDKAHRKIFEGNVFDRLLMKNFIGCITVMVRARILQEVGLFPENFDKATSEDWHLWLRIAKKHRIGYIGQPLAKYRWKGSSLYGDYTYAYPYRLMVLSDMENLYGDYLDHKRWLLKKATSGVLMRYGYSLYKTGQRTQARKMLRRSIARYPVQWKAYLYWAGAAMPWKLAWLIARVKKLLGIYFMEVE